jgi:hypothetical protein
MRVLPKFQFEIQSDGTLKKIAPDSASQPQTHETCELRELLSSAHGSISSLLKVSMAIRSSPTRDDYSKAAARYDIPSLWDVKHVEAKHGNAKYSQQWLLERLGNAITLRRKYLKYREEHNRKILRGNEGLEMEDGHTIAPTATHTLLLTVATAIANNIQAAVGKDTIGFDETARS